MSASRRVVIECDAVECPEVFVSKEKMSLRPATDEAVAAGWATVLTGDHTFIRRIELCPKHAEGRNSDRMWVDDGGSGS
jgi:hypothetical protein